MILRFSSLIWVTRSAVELITEPKAIPAAIGSKALGLLSLPTPWVPKFIVVEPGLHESYAAAPTSERSDLLIPWVARIESALDQAGIDAASDLHVRSNAISEIASERGRYKSVSCPRDAIGEALVLVVDAYIAAGGTEPFPIIVQASVSQVVRGYLSNERRVAEEYREALVTQIDVTSGVMESERITRKGWRRSLAPSSDALPCQDRGDILPVLREPLALAVEQRARVLFEWVWDGSFMYIVQADHVPDSDRGVSPVSVMQPVTAADPPTVLECFRLATRADVGSSGKLRNHFAYEDNGFRQPPFYLLDDAETIREVLDGTIPEPLARDLGKLTFRPLVIRTSGPSQPGTLLPRSDQLMTGSAAGEWLLGRFREGIAKRNLKAAELSLLAHHFIPALSAAFSAGSAEKRNVYVEALWGIPEGLYYYPCDAYLVNTQVGHASELNDRTKERFTIRKRLRYKGEFVAPDSGGRFVLHETARPWDWKSTIEGDDDLAAMAMFTRRLALKEGRQVNLMWFTDVDPATGLPRMLPWYHDDQGDWGGRPADGYVENAHDERFSVRRVEDLNRLEDMARDKYVAKGKRLVISLDPTEDAIIRDYDFAKRVGEAAAQLGAIVELRGGILTHVYFVLRRCCEVSVRNQATFGQQPTLFRKLVRDRIPEVVAAGGEIAKIRHLPRDQRGGALKVKLVEEAFEVRDAAAGELINELADVLEVVDALAEAAGIDRQDLEATRQSKRERRGGFEEGIVLVETSPEDNPTDGEEVGERLFPDDPPPGRIIEAGQSPRLEEAPSRPFDVRTGADFVELVQSSSIRLTHPEWVLRSPRRVQIDSAQPARSIQWTIEGRREGARLILRFKVLLGTTQLSLPLGLEDDRGEIQ